MKIATRLTGFRKDRSLLLETDAGVLALTFFTPKILRVRMQFDGMACEEPSYQLVMTDREDAADAFFGKDRKRIEPLSYTVKEEEKALSVTGGAFCVNISREEFGLSIADEHGRILSEDIGGNAYALDRNRRRVHRAARGERDHYYGFGETTGPLDKNVCRIRMKPQDSYGYDALRTDPLYKHIPFFFHVRENGEFAGALFYHNPSPCEFDMGKSKCNYYPSHYIYTADGGSLDYFVLAAESVDEALDLLTQLIGRPVMLPRYALGYLGSSMYYSELPKDCDRAIETFIDHAFEMGFYMDGFQLSSGYTTYENKRCVFTWDRTRFPNPEEFFAEMKKRHIHVSCNVKPGILAMHPRLTEFEQTKNFFVRTPDESGPQPAAWWGGRGYYADLTNPDTREVWKENCKNELLRKGADSIWNDNCEYDGIADDDAAVTADGAAGVQPVLDYRSVMANNMCRIARKAILEADPDHRPYIVCRAGSSGIGHLAQTWAGDNTTGWEALAGNIPTILGMGLSGAPNEGADIGGFYGPAPSEELLLRWVQMAVFMPRFSIHSSNTDNTVTEPWMYPKITPYLKKAVLMRYHLMPDLYSLMAEAALTGRPILRPLFEEFPKDPAAGSSSDCFMFGSSLLVAPIVEPGAQIRRIALPKGGIFYDLFTTKRYEGGKMIDIKAEPDRIPVFLRTGAMLLTAAPSEEYDIRGSRGPADYYGEPSCLRILAAPEQEGSRLFYEDDGSTNAYEIGVFCKNQLTLRREGSRVVFCTEREGTYRSAIQTICLEMICPAAAPFSVTLSCGDSTRSLERVSYLPDFDREKTKDDFYGFFYHSDSGRAEIRFPRPKENYQVTVSFEIEDLIKI